MTDTTPERREHLDQCPCTAVGVPSCVCDDNEECGPQCRHHCICDRIRAALAAQATAHEAALAEARADMDHVSYVLGQRAERARIRAGVEALPEPWPTTAMGVLPSEWVLAVIDGEEQA